MQKKTKATRRRRDGAIRLVVTADEHARITERARASGRSTAAYLRDLGIQGPAGAVPPPGALSVLLKLIEDIDRTLVRINALADSGPPTELRRREVSDLLARAQRQIEQAVAQR